MSVGKEEDEEEEMISQGKKGEEVKGGNARMVLSLHIPAIMCRFWPRVHSGGA